MAGVGNQFDRSSGAGNLGMILKKREDEERRMKKHYVFTDGERRYFDQLQQNFNVSVTGGVQLIINQQGLPGQWRMSPDGSGLERVDIPQTVMPPPVDVDSTSPTVEEIKKVNGVA